MQLFQGDCLEILRDTPSCSVDMVLADPPYGTTRCKWDTAIPLAPLWEQVMRVAKPNAAILLFSAQPFTTDLIMSNREMFRYEIIWEKTMKSGYLNANRMPLRAHENICVFYKKLPTYHPQKIKIEGADIGRVRRDKACRGVQYGLMGESMRTETGFRHPTDVVKFSNWNGALFGKTDHATKHPTQKPVDLLEYLIKTYSNHGKTVLDFCMGSGSTGVACANTGRDFIGIEVDKHYYNIANARIAEAEKQCGIYPQTIERGDDMVMEAKACITQAQYSELAGMMNEVTV